MNRLSFLSLKKKQYLYAGVAGTLGLGVIGILLWSVDKENPSASSEPSSETHIATAGERINPQEVWVERMESASKLTQEKIDGLEKMMQANAKSVGAAEDKASRLERELEELRTGKPPKKRPQNQRLSEEEPFFSSVDEASPAPNDFDNGFDNGFKFAAADGLRQDGIRQGGIKKIVLQLSGNAAGGKNSEKSTLENTLPAGTFARGRRCVDGHQFAL